jgi:RsiW-degrading membrane proteinase PrsW (M82 family)
MALILLTIGPPLLILFYIIKSDRFIEPASAVIKIFVLGMILIFPAGWLNGIFVTDETAYLAGLTEESLKYLAFILFVTKLDEFDEKMDAIVYGTLISLGYATYENYEYVYLYFPETSSYLIASLRAFSAIPMHAMCGVIMGYHLGMYYFKNKSNSNLSHLFLALLIPIFVHGFYNYLQRPWHFIFLIGISFYVVRLHKEFVIQQSHKKNSLEVEIKS